MNELQRYKNFNMLEELHVAGNFIYDAMNALNRTTNVSNIQIENSFSFLYYASVGIERLLKIIVVLYEGKNETILNTVKKYKHNHQKLNEGIIKYTNVKLNFRENILLDTLMDFYNHERYGYFELAKGMSGTTKLMTKFLKKILQDDIRYSCTDDKIIIIDTKTKEIIGRTLGGLAAKYYGTIKDFCLTRSLPLYTYELKSGSSAEKIFINHTKNSLQEQKVQETTAIRELIVFLRNTKKTCNFLQYLDGISPIDLDPEMTNYYLEQLCCGVVPQDLIDEVYTIYDEEEIPNDRINLIGGIGNRNAPF